MLRRACMAAALAALAAVSAPRIAIAQQAAASGGQTVTSGGWTYTVTPYLWLPTINTNLSYGLPPALGARLPTDISVGPGQYIDKLHFAAMVAAEARQDRFSILTDFVYTSVGAGSTTIRSVDFFGLPSHPINKSLQLHAGTNLEATIWTLAGGYTVLRGDWGYFDVIAGFRYLGVSDITNFDLNLTLTGPRGNGATFGGTNSVSTDRGVWNGIAGVRGRIRLGDFGLFIPYYFDIGGGGSQPTWQIASGLGYQTGWVSVSATYRYLSFEQGNSTGVQHVGFGGPMLAVSFTF